MLQRQKAYREICETMLYGQLPPGHRLSDSHIAKQLGVSRTPVRQAMEQLCDEGRIDGHPEGGFAIRQPTPNEMLGVFDLRRMIECHAITFAARNVTSADIDKLQVLTQRIGDSVSLLKSLGLTKLTDQLAECIDIADAEFHLYLLRLSENKTAIDLVSEKHPFSLIFGHCHYFDDMGLGLSLEYTYEHHLEIVSALEAKDPKKACNAMQVHLDDAYTRLSAFGELNSHFTQENLHDSYRSYQHISKIYEMENSLGS